MKQADMKDLEVGTQFHVLNGHWHGEIIRLNGRKHIGFIPYTPGDRTIELPLDTEYELYITITKTALERKRELDALHLLKHIQQLTSVAESYAADQNMDVIAHVNEKDLSVTFRVVLKENGGD